ncbi:MAG: hypothetical protein CMO01_00210, partial [Thalassobius sp.]|nr:hypothetical protein [Thalassovita sp.]
ADAIEPVIQRHMIADQRMCDVHAHVARVLVADHRKGLEPAKQGLRFRQRIPDKRHRVGATERVDAAQ